MRKKTERINVTDKITKKIVINIEKSMEVAEPKTINIVLIIKRKVEKMKLNELRLNLFILISIFLCNLPKKQITNIKLIKINTSTEGETRSKVSSRNRKSLGRETKGKNNFKNSLQINTMTNE